MAVDRQEQFDIITEKLKKYKKDDRVVGDTKFSIENIFVPPLMHETSLSKVSKGSDSVNSPMIREFFSEWENTVPSGFRSESLGEMKKRLNPNGVTWETIEEAFKAIMTK